MLIIECQLLRYTENEYRIANLALIPAFYSFLSDATIFLFSGYIRIHLINKALAAITGSISKDNNRNSSIRICIGCWNVMVLK